jgi:hypothetical protein
MSVFSLALTAALEPASTSTIPSLPRRFRRMSLTPD